MRVFVLLITALASTLVQAECALTLPRAGFADAIVEREPVGDGSGASERLWFFTEVAGGAGDTLHHQWRVDGHDDVRVPLTIGADRWRTWSSRRVLPGERLTVRVFSASGCDLGEYGLLASVADDTLTQARALLASGDITGARLRVRQAQEQGNRNAQLTRFLNGELALAEVARDLADERLFVAGGRLEALAREPLDSELRARRAALQQQHTEQMNSLHQDMRRRLAALQRTLESVPPAVSCQNTDNNNDWLPEPEREWLGISDVRVEARRQHLTLLDQRTGLSYALERPCLP